MFNKLSYYSYKGRAYYTYNLDKNNYPYLLIHYNGLDHYDKIFYDNKKKIWRSIFSDNSNVIEAYTSSNQLNKYLFPDNWDKIFVNFPIKQLKEFNKRSLKFFIPISIYNYLKYNIKIKKIIITLILILKNKLPIEMIDKILSFNMIIDFI
jgi:hypothetical protein